MGCSSWTSWVDPFHVFTTSEEEKAAQDAQDAARRKQESVEQQAIDLQREMYEKNIGLQAPYVRTGYQGLGKLYGEEITYKDPVTGKDVTIPAGQAFDLMKDPYTGQTMQMPSYDTEYYQKLGAYEEDPATKAARAMAEKRLAQSASKYGIDYSSPGIMASKEAELGQQYDVTGYDRYKQQLSDRYKALQGEFATKRDINQNEYNRLIAQTNLGLGAATQTGQTGSQYGQTGAALLQNTGNTAMNYANQQYAQTAQQQAQPFNNLLAIANLGVKGIEAGTNAGWFGGGQQQQQQSPLSYWR